MTVDISAGTRLKAGTTGWVYTVSRVSDGTVVARGPNGLLTVSEQELKDDIEAGAIEVLD